MALVSGLVGDQINVSVTNPYVLGGLPPLQAQPGMVWYNGHTLVVWDGTRWEPIHHEVLATLTPKTAAAVDWASRHMHESERLIKLMDKYPMVQSALDEFMTLVKLHMNLEHGDANK